MTQSKAGKETLGAADLAGRSPSHDKIHPGDQRNKPGSGVGQDDAVHSNPGTGVGPDEGQWHSGTGAGRPGDASQKYSGGGAGHPGSGSGYPGSGVGSPGSGTGHPDRGARRPGSGHGQDDAAHQYSGPGIGPDEGQWHSAGGARPGDASYRHPGAGRGDDPSQRHSGSGRPDPHSRLAPLATGEDMSSASRPTDIDEAIARASAGGPLGLAGDIGSDRLDAAGVGGGGGLPYTRVRQAENVKMVMKVLNIIMQPTFLSFSVL